MGCDQTSAAMAERLQPLGPPLLPGLERRFPPDSPGADTTSKGDVEVIDAQVVQELHGTPFPAPARENGRVRKFTRWVAYHFLT
jgi:hypothetical protein